jgi:chloramphenicol-sensitive protein RarD
VKDTKYYIAAVSAFMVWGFFSLVLKPIHNYPSIDILFYRVFSCAILMLLIVLLFKRSVLLENIAVFKALPVKGKVKAMALNIGGGLLLTANWFSFIYVMNHISVKATSLAYLVCPILTTLLAYFILREKLSRPQWAAVVLSIIGCLLLSYSNILDMSFSLIIGLSYAMYLVSQRENKGFDKFISLTFQIVLSALILLPFYPVYSGPVPASLEFYFYIELIAVAFTIIPLLLNLFALKRINTSTVGMMLNINPLIAFCLAAFVYHEHLDSIQIAAYSIILFAIVVFNSHLLFRKNKDVRAAAEQLSLNK